MPKKWPFRWKAISLICVAGFAFCIVMAVELSKPIEFRELPEIEGEVIADGDDILCADYRTPEFVLITIDLLRKYYFDPEKVSIFKLLNIGTGAIAKILAQEGIDRSLQLASPQMTELEARAQFARQFAEAKATLEARKNPRAYSLGIEATQAILNSFRDSHTYLLTPPAFKDGFIIEESYLGMRTVELRADFVYIDRLLTGGNADKAGLKRLDRIVSVNGSRIVGGNIQLASRLEALKSGRLGYFAGQVRLEILRAGKKIEKIVPLSYKRFPSGEAKNIDVDGRSVYYFDLNRFNAVAPRSNSIEVCIEGYFLIRKHLDTNKAEGIIFDLRSNLGGSAGDLREICSCFLPEETLLFKEWHRGGALIFCQVAYGARPTSLPMVVLVDDWSCSAAEVFAQAMKEYGRAVIVGVRTNGAVRIAMEFPISDQIGPTITIASLTTAKGIDLEGRGVTPDIEVALTEKDISAGRDPQLEKAKEVLAELMKK